MSNYFVKECPKFIAGICDGIKRPDGSYSSKYPECKDACVPFKQFNGMASFSGTNFKPETLYDIQSNENCVRKDNGNFERYYTIKSDIANWVLDGNNLLITTPYVENEISVLALRLMYGYFWNMVEYFVPEYGRGKYINLPEFTFDIETYSTRNSDAFKLKVDELKIVDLVVWDDITLIPLKDASRDLITTIVNLRFREGKANIFAGLEIENPQDAFGEILFQKLKHCEHIQITQPFILKKNN